MLPARFSASGSVTMAMRGIQLYEQCLRVKPSLTPRGAQRGVHFRRSNGETPGANRCDAQEARMVTHMLLRLARTALKEEPVSALTHIAGVVPSQAFAAPAHVPSELHRDPREGAARTRGPRPPVCACQEYLRFWSPAEITPESRSDGPLVCREIPDVNEDCVNSYARLFERWGTYGFTNNCATFVAEVLNACRRNSGSFSGQEGTSGTGAPSPYPPGGF